MFNRRRFHLVFTIHSKHDYSNVNFWLHIIGCVLCVVDLNFRND